MFSLNLTWIKKIFYLNYIFNFQVATFKPMFYSKSDKIEQLYLQKVIFITKFNIKKYKVPDLFEFNLHNLYNGLF